MATKKKVGIGAAALLTIIAGIAGGSYAISIDQSVDQSTNIDIRSNDTTTINEGDTIIDIGKDTLKEVGKDMICEFEPDLEQCQ